MNVYGTGPADITIYMYIPYNMTDITYHSDYKWSC